MINSYRPAGAKFSTGRSYGSRSYGNRGSESGSSRSSFGGGSRSGGGGYRGGYSRGNSGGGGNRSRGAFRNKVWSTSELLRTIEDQNHKKAEVANEVAYVPSHTFAEFQISTPLKKNIEFKGYTEVTPIQDQAIPAILQGRDLIGSAQTGTGKTAAFLIPLIDKVSKNRNEKVLIVTPTRELAMQIYEEFREFSYGMSIFAAICIGGADIYRQKSELRKGPSFIIGTPGRIKDLLRHNALDLSRVNNVVLDETDQMVDIGFLEEIKYFISLLPAKRQSLFFSATISPKIREVLSMFVKDPVTVSVRTQEASDNVEQAIIQIGRSRNKVDVLHELLLQKEFEKVLIFGPTKWGVQKLSDELQSRGHKTGAIHGDKRQNQRQLVLKQFKKCEIKILLATDVASRGLDIKDVSHVINYDMPESKDDYIHRIGRTGRANKKGIALTLVD